MISSIKSSTADISRVPSIGSEPPTADDTNSSTSLTWRFADEQQMSPASLEVIQRLETIDIRPSFWQGQKREL
jgi:hypothetical protein